MKRKKIKSDVKVIFTSGYCTELTRELQSWGMAYLQKPYPPAKLLAKIKELHVDILANSRQVLWN
jgi:two-component SAPR family response regulator